jgi:hypothetical protein
MKVFVLSQEGKPLMPTTPRRARGWLQAKRARVVRREPFTIRLRFATRAHVQPARVGVDTGSQAVGIAAIANGEVVFIASCLPVGQVTVEVGAFDTQRMQDPDIAHLEYQQGELQGYETKYQRHQVLALPKSHTNDAVAIACEMGELVKAKGRVGYVAGRREKGAFVIKDAISGEKLLEVTPRALVRVARPTRGWMITRQPVLESI